MGRRTIKLTYGQFKHIINECYSGTASELFENKNEENRRQLAHELTLMVVRDFFHNGSWLDTEFVHQDNPRHLSYLDYMVDQLEDEFYHGSRTSKPVIRTEPMIARIAFNLGFQQSRSNAYKLNRLGHILTYMEFLAKKGQLEFPKLDLNMTYEQLDQLYGSEIDKMRAEMKERMNSTQYNGANDRYEILRDIDYDTAHEIGEWSNPDGKICYTQSESTWSSPNYSNDGNNTCYVLLKKNFKDYKPVHDGVNEYDWLPESGYDQYGLSMIFFFVDESGDIVTCNTRWNHNGNWKDWSSVDQALNEEDISKIIGGKF